MEFDTEEARTSFINGNRQTRISLDAEDTQTFIKELEDETEIANKNLDQVTSFYYDLESLIRMYGVGTSCILDEEQDPNHHHQLFFEETLNPNGRDDHKYDLTFWRIGYLKIGSSWHLGAQKYKDNRPGGPTPQYERLGDYVRLTHAPREVRLQATHHIRDLLQVILNNVRHNKSMSESALERIDPLVTVIRSHFDKVPTS